MRRSHGGRYLAAAVTLAIVAAFGGGTAASAAPPADITNDRKLRWELGFRNDDSFIRALHARKSNGANVHGEVVGIPLSDDEYRELLVRDELGRIDAARVRAAMRGSDDFGGLFIDNRSGGRLHVLTTSDPAALAKTLRPALRHPGRLLVTRAAHTFDELLAAKAAVDDGTDALRRAGVGVSSTGLDVTRNTIRVMLTSDTARHRAAVRALLPAGVGVTFVEQPYQTLLGGNVLNSLPYRGGQSIRPSTLDAPSYACSIGFIAYKTLTGGAKSPSAITAGHCGYSGTWWYQYSRLMGQSTVNTYPQQYGGATIADSMRIPLIEGASNDVLAANYEVFNISGWEGQYGGEVGQTVCNNGASSYRVCGTLVDENVTVLLEGEADNGHNIRVDYVRESTSTGKRGDSGGAVTHTAGSHYASGTVFSGTPTSTDVYTNMTYIHIYNALRALQLDGVYTS